MLFKIPDAKESLKRSIDNKKVKIDNQFKDIINEINNAAYNGDTECLSQVNIYPENISILKEKGYKISHIDYNYFIYWNEIESNEDINLKGILKIDESKEEINLKINDLELINLKQILYKLNEEEIEINIKVK